MDLERLKALLRLASCRSRVLQERLEAQAKVTRSKIVAQTSGKSQASDLAEGMMRVQTLIRDDYLQEAYKMLDSYCQVTPILMIGIDDEFGKRDGLFKGRGCAFHRLVC